MNLETPDWVQDAIFYQIFPDRFAKSNRFGQDYPPKPSNLQAWGDQPTIHGFQGGDLLGVTEKLDYLVQLGINSIYLNPVFASASNHRYHTHDYYLVDPILGGNEAFIELLDKAHGRGIRIVLDGVFNHASRGFFQFNHLLECGPESPYIDWFHVHSWPVNAYAEDQPPNYEAWWGIHSLPKFNTEAPAVREFLWNVATYWLKQGIDGWRLDVPNEINDDSFWQEFRFRCKATNPDAYIVGELWGEAHRWLQGDQFDGQMNYLFARAAYGFFLGDNMDQTDTVRSGYGYIQTLSAIEFAAELDRIFNSLYPREIVLSQLNVLGTHDTPRMMTVANNDKAGARLLFLCQMTSPGAPNVYYGDEIGMAGRHDPDNRRAFPWQDESSWDHKMLAAVRHYAALRHNTPALRRGDFRVLYASGNVVLFQRQYEGQTAVIAFNAGARAVTVRCPPGVPKLPEKLVDDGESLMGGKQIRLEARSGRVWANVSEEVS